MLVGRPRGNCRYPRCQTAKKEHNENIAFTMSGVRMTAVTRFSVDILNVRESGEMRIAELAAGGHKQIYWVREATEYQSVLSRFS